MKTSELLYRAAELLERGWCQGTASLAEREEAAR